jgi:hypothetical protein
VILHLGRVRAQGDVAAIVTDAKTHDLHSAFTQLTGSGAATGGAAS